MPNGGVPVRTTAAGAGRAASASAHSRALHPPARSPCSPCSSCSALPRTLMCCGLAVATRTAAARGQHSYQRQRQRRTAGMYWSPMRRLGTISDQMATKTALPQAAELEAVAAAGAASVQPVKGAR